MAKDRRRRAPASVTWSDAHAEQTRAMTASWEDLRQGLDESDRQLGEIIDRAVAFYRQRPYAGDLAWRQPGKARIDGWFAAMSDLRDAVGVLLESHGVEVPHTLAVALHEAHRFDQRVPHDSEHCGLCLLEREPDRAPATKIAVEELRYGPVPAESLPFAVIERVELLATYAWPVDRPGTSHPLNIRRAPGGLEVYELEVRAAVTGAVEHVGLIDVLNASRVGHRLRDVPAPEVDDDEVNPDEIEHEIARHRAPDGDGGRIRDVLRQQLRSEVLRWIIDTGAIPTAADWADVPDWPDKAMVEAAYGSFDALIDACDLHRSAFLEEGRELAAALETAKEREAAAEQRLKDAERRERELAAGQGTGELARTSAELEAARTRIADLEGDLSGLREQRTAIEADLRESERKREVDSSEFAAAVARANAATAEARAALARQQSDSPSPAGAAAGAPAPPPQVIVPRRPELGQMLYRLWLPFDDDTPGEALRNSAAEWIARKQRPGVKDAILAVRDERADVPLEGNQQLTIEEFVDGEDWLWQAHWRHPYDRNPRVRFSIETSVCRRADALHLGIEIGVVRPGAVLRPLWLRFRAPRLAPMVLERFACRDAGRMLCHNARAVRNATEAGDLAQFLLDPERGRPVVHCSARHSQQSLDPDALAKQLAGLAHVTYSTHPEVDDALTGELPERLGVWGGAIRTYYPALAEDPGDSYEHRYISTAEIDRIGEETLQVRMLRDLSQIAASVLTPPPAVGDVRRRVLRARAQAAAATAAIAEAPPELLDDEFIEDYERTLDELKEAREEATQLGEELERSQQELEARETLLDKQAEQIAELSRQVGLAHAAAGNGHPDVGPDAPGAPATVAEAVQRAKDEAAHLKFANSAFSTARESPFRRPADVLVALRRLDELAADYVRAGGFGKSLAERAGELGLVWSGGVGDTTAGKHAGEYTIMYDGRRFLLGPHVALGGGSGAGLCARIYLVAHEGDAATPRGLIVGHVGEHLPDSTTG